MNEENREKLGKAESQLQKTLKGKMRETGLSAHLLEKQAGLKRSSVQNILQGRSRKPSAEILYAIAKILGCSINELLGDFENNKNTTQPATQPSTTDNSANDMININLYAEATQLTNEILTHQNIVPDRQKTLKFIEEVYNYALENKLTTIDVQFARWLAKKWWNE